ncbi:MAG: hypothetical protein ACYCW6_16115 [Candidatus Xenobia bacterium]
MSIGSVGPVLFPTIHPGQFRPDIAQSSSGDVVEIQPGSGEAQKARLREAVQNGHRDIWLIGPASAGKAALVDELSREMNGYPAFHQTISSDNLIGGYRPVARNEYEFMPTGFSRAVTSGKWVTISNVERADHNDLFCLQRLKDGDKLTSGDVQAAPGTRFFVLLDT